MLVAGITAGSSLLRVAKLRAVINESITYRTAYNTFYSLYDRVPGAEKGKPNETSCKGSLSELFNNNLINKKPKKNGEYEYIESKYNGAYWNFSSSFYSGIMKDIGEINYLFASGNKEEVKCDGIFSNVDAKSIDEKIDDGYAISGSLFGPQTDWWIADDPIFEYENDKILKARSLLFKLDI